MSISRLKRLERACISHADRVLTVCEEGKRHYVRDCGASPEGVSVISNTVDLDRFDPYLPDRKADGQGDPDGGDRKGDSATPRPPELPRNFLLTYVGRLGAHRGLETVLDALAALNASGVVPARLLIVGPDDSDNADALRAYARGLGVADRMHVTGWVDFEDVPKYMAASDVCLVPHAATPHTETTVPHKLFQYMAASRPVLVTDVSPLSRIVAESQAGLVTPAGDGEAMVEALRTLAENPERADALGRNGRRAVEEPLNWARDAEALREIYRDLDADHGPESGSSPGSGSEPEFESGRAASERSGPR
jgi:glycosyltransferase involved in cell wall biosynthesis